MLELDSEGRPAEIDTRAFEAILAGTMFYLIFLKVSTLRKFKVISVFG